MKPTELKIATLNLYNIEKVFFWINQDLVQLIPVAEKNVVGSALGRDILP